MSRWPACLAALAPWPRPRRAAQPQFWRIEGARDFLEGDTEGLSIDSEGRVRLAPAARAAARHRGALRLGAGPRRQGRALRGHRQRRQGLQHRGREGALFYDAPELEVHALAVGPDGTRLRRHVSPEGKVYAVDADGQGGGVLRPRRQVHLGPRLRPQREPPGGHRSRGPRRPRGPPGQGASRCSTSAETHITALFSDARSGFVYAGSSPGGILYRIDPTGKVFVLHDSPFREVKSLPVGGTAASTPP